MEAMWTTSTLEPKTKPRASTGASVPEQAVMMVMVWFLGIHWSLSPKTVGRMVNHVSQGW
eukprot:8637849-Alexandrium_andersonii.AAC.1